MKAQKTKTREKQRKRAASPNKAAKSKSASRSAAAVAEAENPGLPAWLPVPLRDSLSLPLAIGLALLAGLTAVAYFPVADGQFLWDDRIFYTANTIHRASGIWDIWLKPSTLTGEGHYWPITFSTLWLEYQLWGNNAAGFHISNIVIHFLNTVLVWHLLGRLGLPGAWWAAALFAVHPIHVDAVAWIIARKDLLATLFYLAAILGWLRYQKRPGLGGYALVAVLYTAALLSKSNAITLPAVLLVLSWWQFGRLTTASVVQTAPLFLLGFLIGYFDYQYYTGRESAIIGLSLLDHLFVSTRAAWFYVEKFLWPDNLIIVYHLWDLSPANPVAWAYVAASLAAAAALWVCRHRLPRSLFMGLFIYLLLLSPALGLVEFGYMEFSYAADRYLYLPSIALVGLAAGLASAAATALPGLFRPAVPLAGALALVGFSYLTWQQSALYASPIDFFRHLAQHNPDGHSIQLNLARELILAKRYEEAYEPLALAITENPKTKSARRNNSKAQHNISILRYRAGDLEGALAASRTAAHSFSDWSSVHLQMARVLVDLKRDEEAIEALGKAKQFASQTLAHPQISYLHALYGDIYARKNRPALARREYQASLEYFPGNASVYVSFAQVLYQTGKISEAISNLEQALAINPSLQSAQQLLAELRRP